MLPSTRACAKCIKGNQGRAYCREKRQHSLTTHPEYFPPSGKRDEAHLFAAAAEIDANVAKPGAGGSGRAAGAKVAASRVVSSGATGKGGSGPARSVAANPNADILCVNGRLCYGAHREFAGYHLCPLKHPEPCCDPACVDPKCPLTHACLEAAPIGIAVQLPSGKLLWVHKFGE